MAQVLKHLKLRKMMMYKGSYHIPHSTWSIGTSRSNKMGSFVGGVTIVGDSSGSNIGTMGCCSYGH